MTQRLVLSAPTRAELVVDGREYAVRVGADLDVEVMAELLRIQQDYRRHGQRKPEKLAEWVERAKALVFRVVEAEGPDEEDMSYLRRRAMSPSEAFQILTLLSGNPGGAEAEVADALTQGVDPEEVSDEPMDPSGSPRRSRGRSSRSARRSGSAQPTGEVSDGETSGSTLATSTAA